MFQIDEVNGDKPSDTGITRISSASWLDRVERALIYVGAFGLGLGHGLVPQVLLLMTAVYRLIADRESRRLKFGREAAILLALTGWMMLSAIPAIRPFAAWGGALGMALSGWVTLGIVRKVMIDKKERGINLILVFLSSACIGAIYALTNYALALAKGQGSYRAELPFVGSNAAGTIFCVAILTALGCFRSADRRSRFMTLLVIVLLTAALIVTQSRGAFVAFLAGLLVFLMLDVRSRRNPVLKIAALVGLVCMVAFFVRVSPSIAWRYARILNPMANKDRLEIWRTALLMMRDHPLFGVGFNNFVDIYPLYQHPEGFYTSISMAHNIFLEFGATTGIPGLVLFAVVVALGILRGTKSVIRAGSSSSFPVTTLAVFVAIITHLQFDITVDSGNTLPFFFIPYGILMLLDEWLELRAKEDEYAED